MRRLYRPGTRPAVVICPEMTGGPAHPAVSRGTRAATSSRNPRGPPGGRYGAGHGARDAVRTNTLARRWRRIDHGLPGVQQRDVHDVNLCLWAFCGELEGAGEREVACRRVIHTDHDNVRLNGILHGVSLLRFRQEGGLHTALSSPGLANIGGSEG